MDLAVQPFIERGQELARGLIHRTEHDQSGIIVILDRGAFAQEFGVVADAEAVPGLLARGRFQRGDAGLLAAAGTMVERMTTEWKASFAASALPMLRHTPST